MNRLLGAWDIKFTLERAMKAQGGGEFMYSSTLSLTSALDGMGVQRKASAALLPGKNPVPTVRESVWAPGPVRTGAENLASTGIRSPDCDKHTGT